jgi:murein DD-endopeptidase MepM/ murein hydrolase activator NlpD
VFRILSIIVFFNILLFGFNFNISNTDIANGATSLIEFQKDKDINYKKIIFDKKSFKVYKHPLDNDKFYVLLPVSYYQKPSEIMVDLVYEDNGLDKTIPISVKIIKGNYKKESITVSKSKVNPSKKYSKRISKEYNEAMKIYNTSTDENFIKTPFILPIKSFITSDFGKARVYNGSLKGYHSGTDFRAKVGTPIKASNDGVVVLVKDRFYSGGTVIINHGRGIYSCYFHMSKFNVKQLQYVKKGDIIGLSGVSGRVTGPHLHFALRVGGVQVDPLQFVTLINNKLLKNR